MDGLLKKYVHQNWEGIPKHRNEKYYFVPISDDMDKHFLEVENRNRFVMLSQNGSVNCGIIQLK